MAADMNDDQLKQKLAERFGQLPKEVQNAILSADVETRMRELAGEHKLHFDQWAALENEVMFALLGFEPAENLAANIEREAQVPHEVAVALADDVSRVVFAPIRASLEQGFARTGDASGGGGAPAAPEEEIVRAAVTEQYRAGQASSSRRIIEGDPYRESIA